MMDISQDERVWLHTRGSEMLMKLGIKPGDNAADFGCGEGRYAIPLSQVVGYTGSVYAIEHIDDAVKTVQERLPLFSDFNNFNLLKVESLQVEPPLPDNTIDSILVFDVLQYIDNWNQLFSYFFRALKPEGYVFIYPAALPHPGDIDMESVIKKMEITGFEYKSADEFHMMHSVDMVKDTVHSFCCSKSLL